MQQSIGHLPKPPTRKKQVAPVIRAQNVFAALTVDIERAARNLQSHTSRDPRNLWVKVDKTRDVVSMVTVSLQDYKDSPQKDVIVAQLRNLERELARFQRDLPPDPRPLFYDSGVFKFIARHPQFLIRVYSLCIQQSGRGLALYGAIDGHVYPCLQAYTQSGAKTRQFHPRLHDVHHQVGIRCQLCTDLSARGQIVVWCIAG
jgi:hypothetical protein